jgi:uncharacterized protein YycO
MTITLRFTKDNNPMGAIIRFWTWSEWDHCEIVTGSGYLGARPDGGVRIRPFNYTKPLAESFARIAFDSAFQERRFLNFVKDQIDKPYDFSAILGFASKRDWHNPDSWICSEIVAAAAEYAGKPLLNGDKTWRFSPRDIAISPLVIFD